MNRRHIELQIRAVVVTYRIERGRRDARTMQSFLARAAEILDGMDADVHAHPDLTAQLREVRRELADVAGSSSSQAEEETRDTARVKSR